MQEEIPLEGGIYNIVNKANGEYLNAFDLSYTYRGYAYTASRSGEEGENVLVVKQDDGTYLLYPQSETGKYAFFSDADENRVAKSRDITDESFFSISGGNDGYVITDKSGKALCVSEEKLYKRTVVVKEEKSVSDSQKWEFKKVEVSSLQLKTVATSGEVKVNSVSAVYAITKPAYMKNLVEWSSSDESVVMIDSDGSFCALSVGSATVTAKLGTLTKSIKINVVDEDAFTWYSQHLATAGGWHGGDLANVYFQSGVYKRFIINGFNRGLDWMDEGCFLTSIAMVFHNLGVRYTDGYDFRFEADGNIEVDPYVVALANSGNRGLTTSRGKLYHNPILISYNKLKTEYTLHGQPLTYKHIYGVSKASLKAALDRHPEGVIVGMQNSYNGTHYIVVTECVNPDAAKPSQYKFKIYDSAGLRSSHGDDVLFEESISYETMHYRYSHMRSMIVFDIVATED